MDLAQAVRTCFSKYATFDGRASRSEFWWFSLVVWLVVLVVYLAPIPFTVTAALLGGERLVAVVGVFTSVLSLGAFAVLVGLAIPLLAAGSRRLHDCGQSAWLLLLLLVPCGGIALIVLWALDGTPGDNAFGARPV